MTMHLSSTVMEIRPFVVVLGRLFQEQRSVVGQSSLVRRSALNITLILYTPLCYVRNVAREE